MRMNVVATILAIIFFGGQTVPVTAQQNCQLTQYASLDLGTDEGNRAYIPVGINGVTENLLVDTGGVASVLTESTVLALRLPYEFLSGGRMVIMPRTAITRVAHGGTVQLGNMRAAHVAFLVMPDHLLPAGEAGILGPDVMGNYDVELDFANAKFKLFSPDHCPGNVVYWTHEPYAQIPFQMDAQGHISTTVQLDGKSIQAILDTGSSRSTMGFESASGVFGWDNKTADMTVTSRRRDGSPQTYHFPFKTLALSGVTVNNPDIVLVRQLSSDDFRIRSPKLTFLIGMNILRQLHLYISYRERNLYVTAAGAH